MATRLRNRDAVRDRARPDGAAAQPAQPQQDSPATVAVHRIAQATGDQRTLGSVVRGLGAFSLSLGSAQLAVPGLVCRAIGVRPSGVAQTLQRAVGVREIAAGAGLLTRPRPAAWLWARVGGDAMDIALLSVALTDRRNDRGRVGGALGAVAAITAVDTVSAVRMSAVAAQSSRRLRRTAAITIRKPVEEVYRAFRQVEPLPGVQRQAEITDEVPGELLCWRSVDGAPVPSQGCARFHRAPGDRGTEIVVELEYAPRGGPAALLAKLAGEEPQQRARDQLRCLKQVLEIGEVVRSR
ncbi:MAG TPA: cyclase [Candidatus Dormibacteraeota bacterium]|jgi:uncharacterized membrane protein|nr:cyclase [Candidatus Dormibacteraeota bacterium]